MKVIICDIDGTIADLSHRLHYIDGTSKKDYDSFYGTVAKDSGIVQTLEVVRLLEKEYKIIFVTGRRESCRDDTTYRLDNFFLPYDNLYMRPDGDYRPDTEIKREIYEKHLKHLDIFCVFDDRPGVVEMWRELGLFVFDVNHRGNF